MLGKRIVTALVSLVVIGGVLYVVPPHYTEMIIGLLIIYGAWEWSGFLGSPGWLLRGAYTAIVAACMVLFSVFIPEQTTLVLQIGCIWWLIAFLWNLRYPTPIPVPVRWACGLLVLVPLYLALLVLYRLGVEYLLFVLLIVWAADAGAYFAGKRFGRVKLAPAISPGKTWEGVFGGMLLVAALAIVVATLRDISIGVLLPFCLAVAALSVVGDLTVSMFKRTAGVKDSGSLFPGHGGVLDRIDSVAAAGPLFALGIAWLELV